ncbi:MAG: hypothetical protein WAU36_03550 [Cyclobacteriaceae bacterium]
MKLTKIASIILVLFAFVTLFMSGSVIFDLFGIREKEGNYVLFIVVTNFMAGFLYLLSAYGLFTDKVWTVRLLTITTVALILSFFGLLFHINSGGVYEEQTVKAMIFRISLTAIFAVLAWRSTSKSKTKSHNN